jgi:gliding motility-associated lipoprotein GldH
MSRTRSTVWNTITLLIGFVGLSSLISCDKKRVFDEYKSVGTAWHKDSVLHFDFPKIDTTKQYNLFINIRDNDNYPFNNLFVIVSLEQPDGITKVDTLEYQMADAEGNLLGNGFTDIKESKLVYKERMRFKSGIYKAHIRHAARQTGKLAGVEKLNGVTEVGFRIEKIE